MMNMSKWNAKEGQKIPKDVHEITLCSEGDVTFNIPKWVSREDIRDWYIVPTSVIGGKVMWTLTLEMKDGERRHLSSEASPRMNILFFDEGGSGVPAKEE